MRRWVNSSIATKATYHSWAAMKRRCYNSRDKDFQSYGGRGISVCERWRENYDAFYEDMGPRPQGMTLERTDTNKPYGPANCIWGSREDQSNNRRNNRLAAGQTAAQIARKSGRTRQSVLYRMNHGLPPDGKMRAREAEHGTVSRYSSAKHKCRCAACREAWRDYQAKRWNR
jgi:hypothetical protein